jgi:hypothetical protein
MELNADPGLVAHSVILMLLGPQATLHSKAVNYCFSLKILLAFEVGPAVDCPITTDHLAF